MTSKVAGEGDDDDVKKSIAVLEPRHENKSFSACREIVNERV